MSLLRAAIASCCLAALCVAAEPEGAREAAEAMADQYVADVQERLESLENPRFLVFLLPDPVDSHFARDFDVYLSAFRQAMTSKGYQLNRFELTWPRFGADGDLEFQVRQAPDSQLELQAALNRYRRTPGVLIFRRDPTDQEKKEKPDAGPRDVVAFLVGETPTWGPQTAALRSALDRIAMLAASAPPPDERPSREDSESQDREKKASDSRKNRVVTVGIVGPTYSGSISSLATQVERWKSESTEGDGTGWDIEILSGTASNASNCSAFDPKSGIHYEQLPARSDYRLEKLIQFVMESDRRIQCDEIVILRESSPFGAGSKESETVADGSCDLGKLTSVTYPINISALRQAHEASDSPASGAKKGLAAGRPGSMDFDPVFQLSRLPVSLAAAATPDDRIPLYGRDLTPQTLDMVVGEVVRQLDLGGTLAIGIVGTNVRDKLFLATEIARHADGIRLFTDEPDVLLSHPGFSFATHGMLTISTNRMEDTVGTERYFFPSDAAHGVFRATRRIVEQVETEREAEPIPGACGSEGVTAAEPALWTGVVGRGRLLMIGSYPAANPGGAVSAKAANDAEAPRLANEGAAKQSAEEGADASAWKKRPQTRADPINKRLWALLCLIHLAMGSLFAWRIGKAWPENRYQAIRTTIAFLAAVVGIEGLVSRSGVRNVYYGFLGWPSALESVGPWVLLPVAAFAPVAAVGIALGEEFRQKMWGKFHEHVRNLCGADRRTKIAMLCIQPAVWIGLTLVAGSALAGYYWVALRFISFRHLDLNSGLSLVPAASIAYVVLAAAILLLVERERVGSRLNGEFGIERKLGLFGHLSNPRKTVRVILSLIAAFTIAGCVFERLESFCFFFAYTLEGSAALDAFVNAVFLVLTTLAVEALWFAFAIRKAASSAHASRPADDDTRARDLLFLWRSSLVAGPAWLLLLLLGIEIYPFEPKGLLMFVYTLMVVAAVLAALGMLIRFERDCRTSSKREPGVAGLLSMFSRESAPLSAVAVISALALIPNVRERLGGLVDILVRIIG